MLYVKGVPCKYCGAKMLSYQACQHSVAFDDEKVKCRKCKKVYRLKGAKNTEQQVRADPTDSLT